MPCILLSRKEYEEMLQKVFGKKVGADTLLDIFYDGQDVFVDLQLKFIHRF